MNYRLYVIKAAILLLLFACSISMGQQTTDSTERLHFVIADVPNQMQSMHRLIVYNSATGFRFENSDGPQVRTEFMLTVADVVALASDIHHAVELDIPPTMKVGELGALMQEIRNKYSSKSGATIYIFFLNSTAVSSGHTENK